MKTKFLCLAFCIVLLASPLPTAYAAPAGEPTVSVKVPAAAVKPGDAVTVQVILDNNPGLAGMQLEIGYDESILSLNSPGNLTQGAALGDLVFVGLNADTYRKNPLKVSWAGAANDYSNGTILNMQFNVLSTAKAGAFPVFVSYVPANTRGQDGKLIELSTENGSISVEQANAASGNPGGGGGGGAADKPAGIVDASAPLAAPESFAAFIKGFEDNTFRGNDHMTREQFITILYRLKVPQQTQAPTESLPSFPDVSPGRWSYAAIEWAKKAMLVESSAGSNFRPAEALTRAEMAVMLVKADGLSAMAENSFSDLSGHQDKDNILRAVKAGIFTGYPDGSFMPEGKSTRSEAVTALVRYLLAREPKDDEWQGINLIFSDVQRSSWDYKYIALAVNGM